MVFYNLMLTVRLSDVLDVALVAVLVYHFLLLLAGTRAANLLKGLGLLLLVRIVAERLQFLSLAWIIQAGMAVGLVAIIVIFQPELRAGLERIGRGGLLQAAMPREEVVALVRALTEAVWRMSRTRTGALIVLECRTGLREFVETGVRVDGTTTAELLLTIFKVGTALHDGAVVVRGDRLAAASCFLPLSQNPDLDKDLGSRHRAALGVSEVSDAVAVVVSEETGQVSWAEAGSLSGPLDEDELERRLFAALSAETHRDALTRILVGEGVGPVPVPEARRG